MSGYPVRFPADQRCQEHEEQEYVLHLGHLPGIILDVSPCRAGQASPAICRSSLPVALQMAAIDLDCLIRQTACAAFHPARGPGGGD